MLTTFQKVKETILLTFLNVLLPTSDIFTDQISITKLYIGTLSHSDCDDKIKLAPFGLSLFDDDNIIDQATWNKAKNKCIANSPAEGLYNEGHPIWATSLLVPFLINYLTTWAIWWSIDKRKTISWIAPLLSFYPQLRAIKVIYLIWTNPKKGLAKKRILLRDATEGETYYEAIPTTAIFTFIVIYALIQGEKNWRRVSPLTTLIGSNASFFAVTFATSLLTASLGLSKALMTGPCRIFPEGQTFSGRFLLLVCANLITVLGKIALLFSSILIVGDISEIWRVYVSVLTVLLPGLITALVLTWHSKMLKTFFNHPSFYILPIFTCFTFSSSKKTSCCTREGEAEGHIRFSVNASLCNLFVSFLACVIYAVTTFHLDLIAWEDPAIEFGFFIICLPIPFFGLLLNLLFLCNMRPTTESFNCCYCCRCCCCCCSVKAAIEYGIYKPDQPSQHFILKIDADGTEEVCPVDENDDDEEEADKQETEMKTLGQEDGEMQSKHVEPVDNFTQRLDQVDREITGLIQRISGLEKKQCVVIILLAIFIAIVIIFVAIFVTIVIIVAT